MNARRQARVTDFHYKAYLSYSHEDRRWADWLHRSLERYRVPGRLASGSEKALPERLSPIFRDREDLQSAADLGETLEAALKQSEFLLVICSPAAAASRWVNEEIERFKGYGRPENILCVIVDGDPQAEVGAGGCFPPALLEPSDAGRPEPLAADPREFADGKRLALLKVASGLLGVRLDDLRRRDLARQRQRRALAGVAAVAVIALLVLTVTAKVSERQERAQAELERAQAEQMAAFIVDLGEEFEGDLDLETRGRMSARAMDYLDQIDADRLSVESRIKVGKALRQIGDVNLHQGDLDEARAAFERSREVFVQLTEELPDHDEAQFELSQAEFYSAMVMLESGENEAAKAHMRAYLEIAEAQHEANPDDPRWLLELSYATSAMVNIGLNLQEPVNAEVLEAIDRNIALAARAMEAWKENPDVLANYGNELAFAADAYLSVCEIPAALSNRIASLEVSEELLEQSGAAIEYQLEVGFRNSGLATVYRAKGDLDKALSHQQAALETFQQQFNRDPSNETNIADLASGHRRSALLYMKLGDLEQAAAHQLQARNLLIPLLADGEFTVWQADVDRRLSLDEITLAQHLGDHERALEMLDWKRPSLTSVELGDNVVFEETAARIEYRFLRWRLTGSDPGAREEALMRVLPSDQGEYTGCYEADLLARHGLMVGDTALATEKVNYLMKAGYREPAFLEFCRSAGLCQP